MMFKIDDDFLASVGYDVAALSDEQKQQYIGEITAELNERVSEKLVSELSDQQVDEFNEIQESPDRALRWLDEFHAGYRDSQEYRQIRESVGNDSDAATFFAAALWMRDAVPSYGQLIQDELNGYQAQLIQMRQAAN